MIGKILKYDVPLMIRLKLGHSLWFFMKFYYFMPFLWKIWKFLIFMFFLWLILWRLWCLNLYKMTAKEFIELTKLSTSLSLSWSKKKHSNWRHSRRSCSVTGSFLNFWNLSRRPCLNLVRTRNDRTVDWRIKELWSFFLAS